MRHLLLSLLLLLLLLPHCLSHKILVYNPLFAMSHVKTLNQIAEVLAEAGHDVVQLQPSCSPLVDPPKSQYSTAIVVPPPPLYETKPMQFDEFLEELATVSWNRGYTPFESLGWRALIDVNAAQCKYTLSYPGLLDRLRAEKFDFALSETFEFCGFGIFHEAGIDRYAVASTTGMMEFVGDMVGVPNALSYVPAVFASVGNEMSLWNRMENVLAKWSHGLLYTYGEHVYDAIFNEHNPEIPPSRELVARSSLVFTNDDPLLDFPRPTLAKIVPIGGISVVKKEGLNEFWNRTLSLRPRNVLVSFGTISLSRLMPAEYKKALLQAIDRFPNTTFIWKYERPEDQPAEGRVNVVVNEWMPQSELLADPRVSLFITHGGMGSTQEAVHRGVPQMVVPMFADQYRNGKMMARAGSGVLFPKTDLSSADKIEDTIRMMLEEEQYHSKAAHVASMLANRPFTARDMLIRNVEFAATFGDLDMMDPVDGKRLWYFQYHLWDVYVLFASIVLICVFSSYKILRFACSFVCRSAKVKTN